MNKAKVIGFLASTLLMGGWYLYAPQSAWYLPGSYAPGYQQSYYNTSYQNYSYPQYNTYAPQNSYSSYYAPSYNYGSPAVNVNAASPYINMSGYGGYGGYDSGYGMGGGWYY